jgi:hypothetical protein
MEHKISLLVGNQTSFVVIQQPVAYTAFREPILDWNRIPVTIWTNWNGKTMGLQEWAKEFQAIDCEDDVVLSVEDIEEATLFHTPAKRKRDNTTDEGPFSDNWEVVPHSRALPRKEAELDQTIKGGVTREFLTKTSIITLGTLLEQVARVAVERFEANEKDNLLMAGVL